MDFVQLFFAGIKLINSVKVIKDWNLKSSIVIIFKDYLVD
jgi:hypothetical protein